MSTGRVARRRQRRDRRERVGGIVLVSLGVVVLVVAVLALVNRHGTNNTANRTVIVTGTPPHSSASVSPTSPRTPSSSTSTSSRPGTPVTSTGASTDASSGSTSAALLPVVLLNNTRLIGLGRRAAGLLQAQGYTVTSVGNYRNNIVSTCVYYDPSTPGAEQAAAALKSKFSWIARTKPKFTGLPAGPVVLVLTADIP